MVEAGRQALGGKVRTVVPLCNQIAEHAFSDGVGTTRIPLTPGRCASDGGILS
jgi:hypothetical protein